MKLLSGNRHQEAPLRKESTTQVIVPSIVFALVMHFVFQKVFMANLSIPWLLIVLGVQSALFTAWAFEKIPGSFTIAGAALAALTIDGIMAVRSATVSGSFTSPPFIGAALSSLLIVAALYTSYQLTTSAGYWFSHRIDPAAPIANPGTKVPRPTATTTPSQRAAAAPSAMAGSAPNKAPGKKTGASVFRIHHARTGQQILTCPCEQVGQHLHIKSLKSLLVDYDPDTVEVVQITWTSDTTVDIHVEGELKGSGRDHYTLLEFED